MSAKTQITYFPSTGEANTPECVGLVKDLVAQGKIKHVVVATTSGATGAAFAEALAAQGADLVVVTHSAGFAGPNTQEHKPELVRKMTDLGAKVLTCTVLTHSLETCFTAKFGGVLPTHIIAHSLRRWGEGSKVACEIVMEACDAGMIPEGVPVASVGGTGRGADTVMVIRSAPSKRFLELKVLGVIAMPGGWQNS